MKTYLKNLSRCYTAGSMGGLLSSLVIWKMGDSGLTAALGVNIAPYWTSTWIYPRVVWGGLWGILFVLPFLKQRDMLRGFVYSLGPSIITLLVVYPYQEHKGVLGLTLGTMTPLVILFTNSLWGICAVFWLEFTRE